MTTDQRAARKLVLSLRRFDRAVSSQLRSETQRESYRANVITHIADLLSEFGLPEVADVVTSKLPEFDGRHIPHRCSPDLQGCCITCGVSLTNPCSECGQRGYHRDDCKDLP